MAIIWKSRESKSEQEGIDLPATEHPEVIRRFLRARGITTPEQIQNLVSPKLSELKDPTLLKDMKVALDRLVRAHQNKERVCIYADFDLDGGSGLALLYSGMKALGFSNLRYYQPKRLSEGYGFHASAVDELQQDGVGLIVTVDVGITAVEACQRAQELEVDVIITDHHQPSSEIPKALAIVNPNQLGCDSGLNYLCGAGVAFYLLRGLKRALVDSGYSDAANFDLKESLDFLSIGTLTDMVPLTGDNRALVRAGIRALAQTRKAGLRRLLEELDLDKDHLTSQEVAIRFSPKLNALSRMEAGILPIDIFLADDASRADELVTRMMQFNSDRVQHQQQGEKTAFEMIENWPHKDFVFVASDTFHRGVIGLLATKIANSLGVPAFVGAIGESKEIVGSARWPQGVAGSLLSALESAKDILVRFGGHHAAAGFELSMQSMDSFVNALKSFFDAKTENTNATEILYDLEIEAQDIQETNMRWLESFEPFGVGFPQPLFRITNLKLHDAVSLRGGHFKFFFKPFGSPKKVEALWFSPPAIAKTLSQQKGESFEIIGELQRNSFGGQNTIQILIKEMRPMLSLEKAPELNL